MSNWKDLLRKKKELSEEYANLDWEGPTIRSDFANVTAKIAEVDNAIAQARIIKKEDDA